jgi:hypothetical protein
MMPSRVDWQPDHAGRRFFGPALDPGEERGPVGRRKSRGPLADHGIDVGVLAEREEQQRGDEVRAVVHREVRAVRERRPDVVVVGRVVFPLDGVDRDPVVRDERSRRGVLRGERVGGAQEQVRAPRRQRAREVGGFGGHVETGREPRPGERLLLLEALPDLAENRHARVRPLDPEFALRRERQVADVVADRHRGAHRTTAASASTPAAAASAAARSRRSQGNSGRPKWPNAAVAL